MVMTGPKISSRATRMVLSPVIRVGRHVEAGRQVGRALAADHDLAAVLDRRLRCSASIRPRCAAEMTGPMMVAVSVGSPTLRNPAICDQPVAHLVEDAAVHDGPGRCGADLAGVEGPGRADAADGALDVGVLEDDAGALAAQLEQRALHGARRLLADRHADLGRPGEADAVDVVGVHQGGRGGRAVAVDQVDDARREAHVVEDAHQLHDGQRVLRCGLHHDGVAGGQRRAPPCPPC